MADNDSLLEHEYDGIKEYDNPTPGWWHAIFLLTIVFSAFYALYWHGNPDAPTIHDKHAAAQLREIKRQFAELGTLETDEQTILRMMNEPKWLAVGENVFKNNCASCHGSRGEGQVGPNFTDNFQKYGTSVVDLAATIANGANQGAMPAWKNRLHPNEIILSAAYLGTLRGKNLSGRSAEGQPLPDWPRPTSGSNTP